MTYTLCYIDFDRELYLSDDGNLRAVENAKIFLTIDEAQRAQKFCKENFAIELLLIENEEV